MIEIIESLSFSMILQIFLQTFLPNFFPLIHFQKKKVGKKQNN